MRQIPAYVESLRNRNRQLQLAVERSINAQLHRTAGVGPGAEMLTIDVPADRAVAMGGPLTVVGDALMLGTVRQILAAFPDVAHVVRRELLAEAQSQAPASSNTPVEPLRRLAIPEPTDVDTRR